ncbi:IS481 family insertion sequence transposase domain-containing protein (plasmid) [Rhizobium phaseoli]|nr:IS481 family insertion sequence transposase domain-containing protein [Rhizobium phaseoli]
MPGFTRERHDDRGIRRAIQNSEESLRTLSKRYGINQKTVAKWKKRTSLVDLPTGPKDPHSTTFSLEEEAVIVAFRRHTLLPHAGASEYQPATEQLLLRKLT